VPWWTARYTGRERRRARGLGEKRAAVHTAASVVASLGLIDRQLFFDFRGSNAVPGFVCFPGRTQNRSDPEPAFVPKMSI
jgi:hypothetical protein